MNKVELAAAVANELGLTKKESEKYLNTVLDTITATLAKGEKVQLVGFGIFEAKMRKAYKGHDPHTGEPIEIPEARVASFKTGKTLREAVSK